MPDKKPARRRPNNKNKDYDDDYKFKKIKKKACQLCADKTIVLDFRNAEQMRKFVNENGKILPRRTTGACAKHQREITVAVNRARTIAILPFSEN